jgi:hypothetical protein
MKYVQIHRPGPYLGLPTVGKAGPEAEVAYHAKDGELYLLLTATIGMVSLTNP